jgi:L-fucose isomerase-like protein
MSEKHKSTSPGAFQVKNRRKTISNTLKRQFEGEQTVTICHNVGHSHISTRTIRDNGDRITDSDTSGTNVFV